VRGAIYPAREARTPTTSKSFCASTTSTGRPAARDLLDEGIDVSDPRLGGEVRFVLVAAEDSHEAPHLGKRLAARLLDSD